MIQQDYVLRQVQQIAQVLAQVLLHRRAGQDDQAQEVLNEGLEDALGLGAEELRTLPREELLGLCAPGGALAGERGVAVAGLLQEDGSEAGRERAVWLYERAIASGEAVPFDVHARIGSLRSSLSLEGP